MKALVLGKGKSGTSAGKLLSRFGVSVTYFQDGDSLEKIDFDLAVKSPGIPNEHWLVQELRNLGIKVYGEIELAYRFSKGEIVGITGTNGKSTTTALVYETLKRNNYSAFIGGNFGIPFSDFCLDTDDNSTSVLELSSFQIEDLISFRAKVSAVLNVTPDHLNRYSSFSDYLKSKLKITGLSDIVVLNGDDENLRKLKGNKFLFFSRTSPADAYFDGTFLISDGVKIPVSELPLKGVHNVENYLASTLILRVLGLKEDEILKGFLSFKGLPHRTEVVSVVDGVTFVNDSKSTNVDSLKKALESFSSVILIAGGSDKGLDFSSLRELFRERVKHLIAIGETADRFLETFGDLIPSVKAPSMEEAVREAFNRAERGDTVLLSPGCASFDMFENFEDRGEKFKEVVKKLEVEIGK
ncbi:UDP-N-acetylmuramoylalanine--D-glutamate ligase [Balnearium lithotrophicum]|uniref:UDP-N-acetylmuramoylalanine--D-glutamate ligase n=1 Tax=Balnearium lithotrophicum TaxID=223788 RepID=A0A521B037_9BACT|nr:UDP-N-acetylmuramoyl-L-alanine--D-glutamate ligase [Balnearium lithotrophicum]SMO40443.1 UDP-N-acetylmuramoylalanine--D-glutamate ligase [Balnearium lithotrophicum]